MIQYLCVFVVFFVSSKSTVLRASWILLQFHAFQCAILTYRCCPLLYYHLTLHLRNTWPATYPVHIICLASHFSYILIILLYCLPFRWSKTQNVPDCNVNSNSSQHLTNVTLFCGCFKLTISSQFRRQDANSNICQWALLGCVVVLLCPSSKTTGRHMTLCTPCPIHRSAQYSTLIYWRHSFRVVVRRSASGSFVTLRGLGWGGGGKV
jgi:hypothetical protein